MSTPEIPGLPVPSFAAIYTAPDKIGPPKSFLLYGPTGTRKTSQIGELVKSGRFNRVLILDINDGTEVLLNDPDVYAAVQDGRIVISPININDASAFAIAEQRIFEVAGVYRDTSKGDPTGPLLPHPEIPDFGFDLVVLDTFNEFQEVAVAHFLATTYNDKGQIDTRAGYGKVGTWTMQIARLLHGTDRFVTAFLMHPQDVEDKKKGVSSVKPKLAGSAKDSLTSVPSVSAYLGYEKNAETNVVELVATVGESDLFDAKNRYRLPSRITDFSMVKLYEQIDQKIAATQPATQTATAA